MAWDGFQREILAALGHTLYTVAEADAHSPALLQAVARAAGVEVSQLPSLPAPAQLRTPAGKRTLWPRLRALRRMAVSGVGPRA
jgi:hypothetical protein